MSSRPTVTAVLPILYRDESFVAVTKPAGMFVHRTEMDRRVREVVVQTVRDQLRQPVFLVHRLDRPTSGIVLLGLSSQAAAAASKLFRERRVDKTYRALVRGHLPACGRIDRPLTSPEVVSSAALDAVTEFETEQWFEIPQPSGRFETTRCSLVRVTPGTGRFHQIRRHFNGISHPVIGDTSHGDSRQNRFFRAALGAQRLMLHASDLSFRQPLTGAAIEISSPFPEDLAGPLDRLAPYRCQPE